MKKAKQFIKKWQLIPIFDTSKTQTIYLWAFNWFFFRFWGFNKSEIFKLGFELPKYEFIKKDRIITLYLVLFGVVIQTKEQTLKNATADID